MTGFWVALRTLANPVCLIAILSAFLVGGGVSGYVVWDYRGAKDEASRLADVKTAFEEGNKQVGEDKKLEVEQANKEYDSRVLALMSKMKGDKDATLKASAKCGRDSESMRLLGEQIDAANGSRGELVMLDGVPAGAPPYRGK